MSNIEIEVLDNDINTDWKDIGDYDGLYVVNKTGDVKSLSKLQYNGVSHYYSKERILKHIKTKKGYHTVFLFKEGNSKQFYVHRLLAMAFIVNKENKKTVNHINGVKSDNNIENLEWNTYSENNHHAYKNGLKKSNKGSSCKNSKLNEKTVIEIRALFNNNKSLNKAKLSRKYNVVQSVIHNVINKKSWKHV